MILSVSLALLVAGILLVALNRTEIPEIPIYLASGIILSVIVSFAQSAGFVSKHFVETEIMRELALLGLSILVFYRSSGMLIDPNRQTAVDSFKTTLWTSSILFAGVTGVSLYIGFGTLESILFGVSASIGSTLLDSGLVKQEARKNHIYGWITEDMNFYDDILGIVVLTLIISSFNSVSSLVAFLAAITAILVSLVIRRPFSNLFMKATGGENELVLLSGIAALISFIWLTETAGISALAGVYAAGLVLVSTELGFRIRERFSSVKDFFTALSFISVGYLLTVPAPRYIAAAAVLFTSVMLVRPAFSTQVLRLQGYDLRTSFMASIQSSQISEIAVVAALILMPFTSGHFLEVVALAFTASIIVAHLIEDREKEIFDRIFSNYEMDPERSDLPTDLEEHVILAGYDWKTQGLEELTEREVVAVDYSLENIDEAEERELYHLLADLYSKKTWEEVNLEEAAIVVSAVRDDDLLDLIEDKEVEAEKILVRKDSDQVTGELREMLREALE